MTEEFEFVRVLKFYDRAQQSFREDDRSTIIARNVESPDQALTMLLRPILRAFQDSEVPLIKISVKAAGPFPHTQWLTELDLDFHAAKVEFHIKTSYIPCSFSMIYNKVRDLCELKFLHLRYVALSEEDERLLREIIQQQQLVVLFLGVVSVQGNILMDALESSTSIQTVALIWLHLERTGHDFPVISFCERLSRFRSVHNLVLLPFASNVQLWEALNAGLRQSTTLQDVMVSGEGGCSLHDDIVSDLALSVNRDVMKALRLNNVTIGERGMEGLCNLLTNSKLSYLDLSGSALSHESVTMFADQLPQMTMLQSMDFREIQYPGKKPWTRETMKTLLGGLDRNENMEEAILSYSPETLDLKLSRDFYLQRNRSRKMMLEKSMGVWPEVLARVGQRDWKSLMYHLLRERIDVLFHTKGPRKKRAASDVELSEAKKVKL